MYGTATAPANAIKEMYICYKTSKQTAKGRPQKKKRTNKQANTH